MSVMQKNFVGGRRMEKYFRLGDKGHLSIQEGKNIMQNVENITADN